MHFIQAKSILSASNGMNIYRGCSHGCIYCDARSNCYQMDHAFEDIAVKENAYEVSSPDAAELWNHFRKKCKEYGIEYQKDKIFAYLHEFEDKEAGEQLRLF